MYKKYIISLLLIVLLLPIFVSASTNPLAKVGNKYYDNLEDAIVNAKSGDVVTLISDVVLKDTLLIDKEVKINLNGNDILADEKVFSIKGGFLDVSGSGVIKETKPNYGAIMLTGSEEYTDEKYSAVKIGKDVILEGWSGIFINHENLKSYGVFVYLDGKINAVNDTSGDTGIGIYVNGNIKDKSSYPVINISDGAEIKSTGTGLYIAGYSIFYIGKATVSGVDSGIGIKSGILNIDGATVISTGEDKTPTNGNNNGIKASGTAIQIESNSGYAGKIELNISNGNFTSKNSNVIYEYIGKGTSSLIYSISISNGTFISEKGKDVFNFSNSFKDIHTGFISGGKYSSNPNSYLKLGYDTIKDNGIYNVVKNTIKTVGSNNIETNKNGNIILKVIISIIIFCFSILLWFNKNTIINFLGNIKNKFK